MIKSREWSVAARPSAKAGSKTRWTQMRVMGSRGGVEVRNVPVAKAGSKTRWTQMRVMGTHGGIDALNVPVSSGGIRWTEVRILSYAESRKAFLQPRSHRAMRRVVPVDLTNLAN